MIFLRFDPRWEPLYDKVFNAKDELKERVLWEDLYETKLELAKEGITDLDNWKEFWYYDKLKCFVKEVLRNSSFSGGVFEQSQRFKSRFVYTKISGNDRSEFPRIGDKGVSLGDSRWKGKLLLQR